MMPNTKQFIPVLAALVIASFVFADLGRGPWVDEYWSVWLSDPTVSFRDTLTQKWLFDVHPPLYSALMWALETVMPLGFVGLRFVNLVIAAGAMAVLWAISPAEVRRRFPVVALLIVSAPIIINQISSARSYSAEVFTFLLFAASTLYVLDTRPENTTSARRSTMVLPIAAIVCLNTHYVAAMHVDIFAGLAVLYALKTRNLRAVWLMVATGLVANGLLVAWFLTQKDFILATKDSFWIDTKMLGALVIVGKMSLSLVPAALAYAWVRYSIGPAHSSAKSTVDEHLRLLLGPVSSALFVLMVLVINLKTPIVQDRYLITAVVATLLSITLVFVKLAQAETRATNLVVVALAILTIGLNFRLVSHQRRWDALHGELQAHTARAACKDLPVYWDIPEEMSLVRNQEKVFDLAYRDTFTRWNIDGRPISALPAGGAEGDCGIVVLYEHAAKLINTKSKDELTELFLARYPHFRGRPIRITISSDLASYLVRL